jgi:septal ring factor EnvC (AmiA/AmiB activator)
MAGVTEEVAKVAGGFMSTMSQQPLALALVVMNFVLLGFLFYNGSSTNTARKDTVDQIVKWQGETDKLLASCVSGDTTRIMLDNMQKITETMLNAEQKEITRMQNTINEERQRSYRLREKEAEELEKLRKQQEQQSRTPPPQPQKFRPDERDLMKLKLPTIPDASPAVLQYQQSIRKTP